MLKNDTVRDESNLQTRKDAMSKHCDGLIAALLKGDDEVFAEYIRLAGVGFYNYSFGNTMLIAWQRPESRLTTALGRLNTLAKAQGHKGRKTKRGVKYVYPVKNSTAAFVWGATTRYITVKTVDEETGEETEERKPVRQWIPVPVYSAEEVAYCDTGEPFEIPHHRRDLGTDTQPLYEAMLEVAQQSGVEVLETKIGGGASGWCGTSLSGHTTVAVDVRDAVGRRVATLAHELAHARLSHNTQHDTTTKKQREAEAEVAAGIILGQFGFDLTAASAGYLRTHGATPDDVKASLKRISEVLPELLREIEEELNDEDEAQVA